MRSIAVAIASLVAACSVLTSLDDLRSDASGDATTVDVIESDAAITDAGASNETATPFCAPYVDASLVYCQSFDSVTDAATILTVGSGLSANVDDADSVSSPSSLHVDLPGDAASDSGGATLHAYVTYSIAASPTTTTVDFEVKVLSPLTAQMNFVSIAIASSSGNHTVSLLALPTTITLQEGVPGDAGETYVNHPSVAYVFDDNWHAVHVVLDLGTKRTSYAIDNQTLEANFPLSLGWSTGNASIDVGVTYAQPPQKAITVRTDNILAQLSLN